MSQQRGDHRSADGKVRAVTPGFCQLRIRLKRPVTIRVAVSPAKLAISARQPAAQRRFREKLQITA